MAERMFHLNQRQVNSLVWAHMRVALDEQEKRFRAHLDRLLGTEPPLAAPRRFQEADWLPDDHPVEPWDLTPPRQAHAGNGRSQDDEVISNHPRWD